MSMVLTVVIAIAVFMLIILIHEFGHFIAAKSFGVLVHEFSIGFGPQILKWKKGETQYSLRLFPLGGYVKLEGEDERSYDPRALVNKPAGKKLLVMAAGALFNLVSGFIIMTLVFAFQSGYTTLEVGDILTGVEGSQAVKLLEKGDEIVAFEGKKVWNYKDFSFLMSNKQDGSPIEITVIRDGARKDIKITPVKYEGRYILGIQMKNEEMTFPRAIACGFNEMFFVVRVIIYSLMMLITGKVPVTEMSGPVGTTVLIGQAAQLGVLNLLYMFALLSVNIGIFNLIPFPALDGGRIFFLLIELIRRKPIPPEKEGMIHFAGLVLLLLLMIFVTSSDIYKLFT